MDLPYSEKLNEICAVRDELYDEIFAELFSRVTELYQRFKSEVRPITDEELETILTELPLRLFTVSERLADIRMRMSVTKLENKHKRIALIQTYSVEPEYDGLSQTAVREFVSTRVDDEMRDDEIAVMVYSSLIDRIEGELSFSRELIMGSKKLWDARRNNATNPVAPVVPELPEYTPTTGTPIQRPYSTVSKDYIKGDVEF